MTFPDISRLPKGAVFHRCALQVNPPEYEAQFRGADALEDPPQRVRAIVNGALERGISALAITGHNDAHGAVPFRKAAEGKDLVIFSGLEVESREGIHILCIYDEDVGPDQLGRFLGAFGIHNPAPSAEASNRPFGEIVREVSSQGGIAIAAHVIGGKGLLRALTGQARARAWRTSELLAVQIPNSVDRLEDKYLKILRNRNPDYRREHLVAVVNCRDVVTPDDLDHFSATCLIKMADINIEGLRQAFLDPGSRIRLKPQASARRPPPEMLALGWKGGFLDGVRVRLNPNLNVLIGGRGAGKSTVIESIRYVLDRSPVGEEASRGHCGIVNDVLRSGTKVSLLVRCRQPMEQDYWIERTVPNPPVVREVSGVVSQLRPRDLLPDAEIYGQHEIAELAKSPTRRTSLLRRFISDAPDATRRRAALREQLAQNRRAILEAQREHEDAEEQLAALPALEEQLARFQAAGIDKHLRERGLLVREDRLLRSVAERVVPLRKLLESLGQELPVDRTFLSQRADDKLPSMDLLSDADSALERLSLDLESVRRGFDAAVEAAETSISRIRSTWAEREERTRDRYERTLRQLQRSGVDGGECMRIQKEIEALQPVRERRELLREHLDEYRSLRHTLLQEWNEIRFSDLRALMKASKTANRSLGDRARVSVTASGDLAALEQLLRKRVGGRLKEALESFRSVGDFTVTAFLETCRAGAASLRNAYGMPRQAAARLAAADQETLMRIEELDLRSTTGIELNLAGQADASGDWRGIEQLSTGQKATAVLLLLLLDSEGPLIVDQPEDDLDNRFITRSIVPRMRDAKQRRQFVFATHNANIPVLGDAELILGLTPVGDSESGRATVLPDHMGSIDTESVRSAVGDLLEGGKAAFETRRRKYGF